MLWLQRQFHLFGVTRVAEITRLQHARRKITRWFCHAGKAPAFRVLDCQPEQFHTNRGAPTDLIVSCPRRKTPPSGSVPGFQGEFPLSHPPTGFCSEWSRPSFAGMLCRITRSRSRTGTETYPPWYKFLPSAKYYILDKGRGMRRGSGCHRELTFETNRSARAACHRDRRCKD